MKINFDKIYLTPSIQKLLPDYSNKEAIRPDIYLHTLWNIQDIVQRRKALFFSYLYLTKDRDRFYTRIGLPFREPEVDLNIVGVIIGNPLKARSSAKIMSKIIASINK